MTSPFLLVSTEVLCPSNWDMYIRTKGKHLMLRGLAVCAASNFHSFDSFLSTFFRNKYSGDEAHASGASSHAAVMLVYAYILGYFLMYSLPMDMYLI
jgi:hypothetical protein